MLSVWLGRPIWLMFTILAVGFSSGALVIHAVSSAEMVRSHALTYAGVVPFYLTAVATLLAILTEFVASGTSERQRQGGRAAQAESDNLMAVYDLSIAAAPDVSAIRKTLQGYADAVITNEWPQMANGRSSQRDSDALGALLEEAACLASNGLHELQP